MEQVIIGKENFFPRVTDVEPLQDHRLRLLFDNGERRIFDAKPLLDIKVYAALKHESIFNSVKAAYGSVLWPGDIDYCPDCLYMDSVREE